MKLDKLPLFFDYYGDLLTEKQRTCFDLHYNQDLSLGEIAEEEGISRQGVHDSLARAENALRTMEEKVGAAARGLVCREAAEKIQLAAQKLSQSKDPQVAELAQEILTAAAAIKE